MDDEGEHVGSMSADVTGGDAANVNNEVQGTLFGGITLASSLFVWSSLLIVLFERMELELELKLKALCCLPPLKVEVPVAFEQDPAKQAPLEFAAALSKNIDCIIIQYCHKLLVRVVIPFGLLTIGVRTVGNRKRCSLDGHKNNNVVLLRVIAVY